MRTFLTAALLGAAVLCTPAQAEDPPPFKDFTFKRVKVGKPAGKRITVQIDPAAQAAALAVAPKPPVTEGEAGAAPAKPKPSAAYAWFWDKVSPKVEDVSATRFPTALAALNQGPGGANVRYPNIASVHKIAETHGTDILKATIGTNVSPALVLAVISVESAGKTDAVSHAGAEGLMQLIPATAERFGVTDSTDPAQNIKGGVAYLNWLMEEFDRDPLMVLAAYNAGENAVKKHGGVPPFTETRDYVPKVLAAWRVAAATCATPPQLVSDGCVFAPTSK